jgi:predicted helicase
VRSGDEFIRSCLCWDDFWNRATILATDTEKGAAFERLTQLYLQTAPEYQSVLRAVWTLSEVPSEVRVRLNLVKRDEGIDLIAETRHGGYWAIQCKFRSNQEQPLTRRELSTFTSLAFVACRDIALAVVAHTCSKPVGKRHLMGKTVEIGLDRWLSLDHEAWNLIRAKLAGQARPHPKPRSPILHQQAAIAEASLH